MKKRLILTISLITFFALALMFSFGLLVTKSNNNDITERYLIDETKLYAEDYLADETLQKINSNIRVTIVSASGTVLVDTSGTEVSDLNNHLEREEIKCALDNKPKAVIRFSETLDREMMYYAEKYDYNGSYIFIRVATPTETISAYMVKTIPMMLLIFVIVFALTFLISLLLCEKLVKPYNIVKESLQAVNNGTYKKVVPSDNYNEVNEVVSEINDLAEKISSNIESISEEKSKLDFILNNISDGIIAVDEGFSITLANKKAMDIFSATTDLSGKSVDALVSDGQLSKAIKDCVSLGQNSVMEIELKNSVYYVAIKLLEGGWNNDGAKLAVALLADVTESKNNEKMRSEFFANASHELKTPLTAIKGFNEIVGMKNQDESLKKPIAQIVKESDRMVTLIDDMLRLSKLENGEKIDKSDVDLHAIVKDVHESLLPEIEQKNLTVKISGKATLKADPSHIYELVKNLFENAVKYNKEGGKIDIKLIDEKIKSGFEISDSGIGIGDEHQSRIFERFYRVEKGRSRANGGTGLGLSIVKHICLLYNAELNLKSTLGKGTTFSVMFKKS